MPGRRPLPTLSAPFAAVLLGGGVAVLAAGLLGGCDERVPATAPPVTATSAESAEAAGAEAAGAEAAVASVAQTGQWSAPFAWPITTRPDSGWRTPAIACTSSS